MSNETPNTPNPEQPEAAPPAKKAAPKRRITVEMSKDLDAVYANGTMIDFSPGEVVIDFIQMLPRMPKAQVKSRVLLSPIHAKLLQRALDQHIKQFEQKFGAIRMPQQSILADQFFRMSGKPGDGDNKGE